MQKQFLVAALLGVVLGFTAGNHKFTPIFHRFNILGKGKPEFAVKREALMLQWHASFVRLASLQGYLVLPALFFNRPF